MENEHQKAKMHERTKGTCQNYARKNGACNFMTKRNKLSGHYSVWAFFGYTLLSKSGEFMTEMEIWLQGVTWLRGVTNINLK